jgi:hypothetical protein
MPNRYEHVSAAFAVAALRESTKVQELPPYKAFAESIGALTGSYWGARLPDLIEPPNRPNHWGMAHSIAAALALIVADGTCGERIHSSFRSIGDEYFNWGTEYASESKPLQATLCELAGILSYMLAGLVVGFPAAYLSHLGLDQLACKSDLPLVGRPPRLLAAAS